MVRPMAKEMKLKLGSVLQFHSDGGAGGTEQSAAACSVMVFGEASRRYTEKDAALC